MKFIQAIVSNNATDDHCQEFQNHDGLPVLFSLLHLPVLPVDFPTTPSCQAVAGLVKSILVSFSPKLHCKNRNPFFSIYIRSLKMLDVKLYIPYYVHFKMRNHSGPLLQVLLTLRPLTLGTVIMTANYDRSSHL